MPDSFKIDENLPIEIAQLLREAGFDALTVYDQELTGQTDEHVISICTSEQRVWVTLDMDFSDIRQYPPKSYPGLVVLRLRRQDKSYVLGIFTRLVKAFSVEELNGCLWIVDENQIKVRE